ncbi:MAG TPA: anhydro-N-acetylmuramic acid kinase [Verrucomicrobiae bacterium]|jgi:anhydro-N-acetylmuramic acid kinase|nr:anhydro-N-acetylmuramic acid kinase [Verrucomicrobiae bacterium]
MKKRLILGIMSGTSLDGVDYALCAVKGEAVRLREFWSASFPPAMRRALHAAASGQLPSHALAQLHHDLGRFYAGKARGGLDADAVGLHGQTVFHNPARRAPATLQLGEPAYLAETLRVPVVSNFRAADMAAGGQGAPLATLFHRAVFGKRGRVCVNNLGGISNVTALGPHPLAFDTGPGNVLMDMAARHFSGGKKTCDHGGRWAAQGRVVEPALTRWLRHEYFRRPPPKSTGRELFGEPFFARAMQDLRGHSPPDALATFTEFTARSLALNYRLHLDFAPLEIILTGGGASNPTLVAAIARQFAGSKTRTLSCESLGWPAQAIEPAAFALLAGLRLDETPGNLPETTGARRAVWLGQITSAGPAR